MKRILLIVSFLILVLNLSSHPWKPSHYVIIDTDGGIDDIRTISMLISSHDVRVLAITVSPGALPTENAYKKVRSLLNSFYHEGLPIGVNRSANYNGEVFPVALNSNWGDETGIDNVNAPDIIPLLSDIFSQEESKVSFICLGSMSTAWIALNELPAFREHVKDIVWSANGAEDTGGYNYNLDKKASARILKQEIPVKIVRGFTDSESDFYDPVFINSISQINTPYARKISDFLRSDSIKGYSYVYSANDEMVAVFLHQPELFINKTYGNISDCTPGDIPGIKESLIKILKGETVEENQVIKELPLNPEFYFDDIGPSVVELVEKYGHDEWVSGVFASEMHRHLGVFAIIGVKMGIRAREYFCTGVDEFNVVTFAGSDPPLSCMNDGLLVSTGATPGHGLLTVSDLPEKKASAEFTYKNRKIRISLLPELSKRISSELREINFIYGLDSDIYWELVREKTIKYWKDLDRHEIFEVEEIY